MVEKLDSGLGKALKGRFQGIRIVEVTGSNPVCSTTLEKSELNSGRKWVRISCFL